MSNLRCYRENKTSSAGLTFNGLLQVAFIVLKLCKVIDWSWWWVMAPTWIPIGLVAMVVAVAFIMVVVKDE